MSSAALLQFLALLACWRSRVPPLGRYIAKVYGSDARWPRTGRPSSSSPSSGSSTGSCESTPSASSAGRATR